ncbi:glycosyltransferase family 1 protein [Phanerochaete sordida]|uniref:Glycosyltransferase family 1 protein n=1 Tax=Phanerochaete sordida TaxID=48140 RepID=A0A9P3GQ92_9APHY|nr:glycosyltransferase family 1 protein [Phanerochaete sordida]
MPPLHIAIVAHTAWGHVRPLCVLAARLVALRDVDITFLTSSYQHGQVSAEILHALGYSDAELAGRIRVVGLAYNERNPLDAATIHTSFEAAFAALAKAAPVPCAATQQSLPALAPPAALIVDIHGHKHMESARRLAPATPIWASGPASLAASYTLFGPFGADSRGALRRRVDEYVAEHGREHMRDALEAIAHPTDEVLYPPGLPPMYKYELFPQEPIWKLHVIGLLHLAASAVTHDCDAFLSASTSLYEPPEAVRAFEAFFALTGRKMYMLGPLVPDTATLHDAKSQQDETMSEIETFMDDVLQRHGPQSLVYISFGTLVWPSEPDRLWTVLDVLLARHIPFILAHPAPSAHIPSTISDKLSATGLALLTPWAPQRAILAHPATGWFLTHAGFNSVSEALCAGVPLICWPFGADAPLNARHLAQLGVAYELAEVRAGAQATRPAYRDGGGAVPGCTLQGVRAEVRGVFGRACGEDGAYMRVRAGELRGAMRGLWVEGGAARDAAGELLDSLL